jgi:hypothetical protein
MIFLCGVASWASCAWLVLSEVHIIIMLFFMDNGQGQGRGMGMGNGLAELEGVAVQGRAWLNDLVLLNVDWRNLSRWVFSAQPAR